jgi:hypothetical protein
MTMSCNSLVLNGNMVARVREESRAITIENCLEEYRLRHPRVEMKWTLQSDGDGNQRLRMNWFVDSDAA